MPRSGSWSRCDRSARTAAIIGLLTAAGWHESAQQGSHKQFRHPTRPGKVTVLYPVKDLKLPTLRSIERQSGIALRRQR